jgi:CRP/FNR family transcriptional regulator
MLADELGSVREVISRILKEFESQGLVRLDRGQIQVLDAPGLFKIGANGGATGPAW